MIYRILVVEDDPTIQRELVTLLQGDGYQAEAVTDFSAVVSTVRDRQPHLILLDIQLPGQSGFALCSQIRAFSNEHSRTMTKHFFMATPWSNHRGPDGTLGGVRTI